MIVICDTSPFINLAIVGQLDLLPQLYGQVVFPQAVYNEIVVLGAGQPGSQEAQNATWIQVQPVQDLGLVTSLRSELDPGESEAIVPDIETQADLLLVDERRGRKVAGRYNLNITGILGVLIAAKKQGHLSQVKPIMDDLRSKARFRIDKSLYAEVLNIVGE